MILDFAHYTNCHKSLRGFSIVFSSILILICFFSTFSFASTYYIATDGIDTNDGSKDSPWRTIGHAKTQLQAGDTLFFREGVYYESSLNLELTGSASQPIVIKSYPGEDAEISGGIPDFREAPDELWELIDPNINLYRSKQIYPTSSFSSAWLLDEDLQIIEYSNMENLTSTNYGPMNGFDPIFVGPGMMHDSDGHLYIRLENNPNDLIDWEGNPMDPVPAEIDPNNHRMAVFFETNLFYMSRSGSTTSHVIFKDLTFSDARNLFDIRGGSNNMEFDNCIFRYGRSGLNVREGRDGHIHNSEFNNGLPDYVYWTDVKNRREEVHEAYSTFQSRSMHGHFENFLIENNLFRDTWEGLDIREYSDNVRVINNHFLRMRDDAVTLRLTRDAEVAYNLMWHVRAGVSTKFSEDQNENNGNVYIHHNIIDVSAYHHGGRPGNYREDRWPVWAGGNPFSGHTDYYPAWWKVYNNTVIARQTGSENNAAANPGNVLGNDELYIYNNIVYTLDHRIIFRGDVESSGSNYDGNVVYRLNPQNPDRFPLFHNFGDGNSYSSLAEFRENSGTTWEMNGLETDPGFDLEKIMNPEYDPDNMWERYQPSNPRVLTPGASYEGLDWPGVDGVDYRGAVSELSADAVLFSGGSGTQEAPWQVETLEQLQEIRNYTDSQFHFVQTADIDAGETANWNDGQGFTPLGDASLIFSGSYDGNGYEITGLTIHRSDYVGLFGNMDGGRIENVRLTDADISGRYAVGGLAGYSYRSEIRNSHVTGRVTGEHRVGGLAGWSYISEISRTYARSSVQGEGRVGGLVGFSDRTGIRDSYAMGEVAGGNRTGGLVGQHSMDWREDGVITTSYSGSAVSGGDDIGGLVGFNEAIIAASYWNAEDSEQEQAIGRGNEEVLEAHGLTTSQMNGLSAFDHMGAFDFEETWQLTDTYPALYWEEVEALDAPPTSAEEPDHPVTYELNQNYPNPFNPVTQIGYSVPEQTHVRLEVYDSIGRQIAVLVNENKSPGRYEVTFDATHLSSGLYLYRLHTDNHTESRRMMLIK